MLNAVFYSLSPFGTGTIETGAGNISITSGVATLTVEQTGNIGAGVCIEYNSLKAFICPNRIGFDSGGTTELKRDTKIIGATSGAIGIVRAVELTSGTWAGGDAAGWIYFESITGTFQNDENINRTKATVSNNIATIDGTLQGNIGNGNTQFVVKTATGGIPPNQSATTVTSIHHVFSSVSDFNTNYTGSSYLNSANLVSTDIIVFGCCYYDHDDQTPESGNHLYLGVNDTTDADRYLMLYTPTGGPESINSQRHSGAWNTNKFYWSQSAYGYSGRINTTKIVIEGLQMEVSGSDHRCLTAYTASKGYLDKCIFRVNNGGTALQGYYGGQRVTSSLLYCYHATTKGNNGFHSHASSGLDSELFHCTISFFSDGVKRNAANITVTNCAVFNNSDDFSGTNITVDHCASDDGDGTNGVDWTNEATDWGNVFADYANKDFSLNNYTGTGTIIGQGTGLSSSEGIWRDIIGTIRDSSTPDIGAFEYVSTSNTYQLSGTSTLSTSTTNSTLKLLKNISNTATISTSTTNSTLNILQFLNGAADISTSTTNSTLTISNLVSFIGTSSLSTLTAGAILKILHNLNGTSPLSTLTTAPALAIFHNLNSTSTISTLTTNAILKIAGYIALNGVSTLSTSTADAILKISRLLNGASTLLTLTTDAEILKKLNISSATSTISTLTTNAILNSLASFSGTSTISTSTTSVDLQILRFLNGTSPLSTLTTNALLSIVETFQLSGIANISTNSSNISIDILRKFLGTSTLSTLTTDANILLSTLLSGLVDLTSTSSTTTRTSTSSTLARTAEEI
jgi:hypothetical protein